MNINCISKCYYQKNGKCCLNEIPTKCPAIMLNKKTEQCSYFQSVNKK